MRSTIKSGPSVQILRNDTQEDPARMFQWTEEWRALGLESYNLCD